MIKTQITEKTTTDINIESPDEQPTALNHDILWQFSELTAMSLRLNDQHQQIEQSAIDQFYLKLQQIDHQLKAMPRHEGNLINFLLRDWIMNLFSESKSEKLIQMHHILRQGEIAGSIVGRKRTIHDITHHPEQFPTALFCLNTIGRISPSYHAITVKEEGYISSTERTDLFSQWLIPASIIWIIVTAGLLFL